MTTDKNIVKKSTKKKPAGPVFTSLEKAIAKTNGEAGFNLYEYTLPDGDKERHYFTWAKGTGGALRNFNTYLFPKATVKPVSAKKLNAFYRAEHAKRLAVAPVTPETAAKAEPVLASGTARVA